MEDEEVDGLPAQNWWEFLSDLPQPESCESLAEGLGDTASINSGDVIFSSSTDNSFSKSSACLSPATHRRKNLHPSRKKSLRFKKKKKGANDSFDDSSSASSARFEGKSRNVFANFSPRQYLSNSIADLNQNKVSNIAASMPSLLELSLKDEIPTEDGDKNLDPDVDIMNTKTGKVVVSITLEKLYDRIFGGEEHDAETFKQFLWGFRHFLSPSELMEEIRTRFESDLNESTANTPTQLRCINFICKWMEKMWFDFEYDSSLLKNVEEIQKRAGNMLSQRIEKTKETQEQQWNEFIIRPMPQILLRQSSHNNQRTFNIFNTDTSLLAQQLTLIDLQFYKKITKEEMMMRIWGNNHAVQKKLIVPSEAYIQWFNKLTEWASTEILIVPDLKKRTHTLEKMIKLAYHLKKHNSFNVLYAIYGGLNNGATRRLKLTWEGVNSKDQGRYKEIDTFCNPSKNYQTYREALQTLPVPVIPMFVLLLRDMTYMDEMPKRLENEQIHFFKILMLYRKIEAMAGFQESEYNFESNEKIKDMCENLYTLDEDTRYNLSNGHEPRRSSAISSRESVVSTVVESK